MGINNTRKTNATNILRELYKENKQKTTYELSDKIGISNSSVKRITDILYEKKIISMSVDSGDNTAQGRPNKSYSLEQNFLKFIIVLMDESYAKIYTGYWNNKIDFNKLLTFKSTNFIVNISEVRNVVTTFNDIENGIIILPGEITEIDGVIHNSPMLNVSNFNIKNFFQDVEKNFTVINNLNALAKYVHFGQKNHQKHQNYAVIAIGVGVGMGLVLNGEIFSGYNGRAGEIGHNFYKKHSTKCYCNRDGCYELFLKDIDLLKNNKKEYYLILSHLFRNIEQSYGLEHIYITGHLSDVFREDIEILKYYFDLESISLNYTITEFNDNHFIIGGINFLIENYFETFDYEKV